MNLIPDNVKFIVIDSETTCATPERGVCEVGFYVIDADFNILEKRESLIDPGKPISASASGVHGLTNSDVADSPTLDEFFSLDDPACYGGLLPGPAVLIGHRVSFDTHTLGKYVEGGFFELDTLRFARRLYPEVENHKLTTLAFALALPRPENAHRALSDVHTAMHLCKHICERLGVGLLELARLSQEPMEVPVTPFGKHRGTPFSEVPKPYLRWMRENMKDLDQDMRYTIDLHLKKKT